MPSIDLEGIYREVLDEIHRAYVFIRFGQRGAWYSSFDETELPGSLQLLVVPEPVSDEQFEAYNEEFKEWIIGTGLRDLVEAFAHFLDRIYEAGLCLVPSSDHTKRLKNFQGKSRRSKVGTLRDEFQIEGIYARHFESFVMARNAMAHGAGGVRTKYCNNGNELAITWRGIDPELLATDGNRYEANKLPEGVQFVQPLVQARPIRERRWKVGERIRLSAMEADPQRPALILTEQGVGYRLVA